MDPQNAYTDEQHEIAELVKRGHSVIVEAVAGSGKTTTVFLAVQTAPGTSLKRTLFLTYSKDLKMDNRRRVAELNLDHVHAHSFHSFACNMYTPLAYESLDHATGMDPVVEFAYDMIIVDEMQDVDPTIFRFLRQIIRDNRITTPQFLFLGDEAQCIFQYRDSDPRFLKLAPRLLEVPFVYKTLSRSFRLTHDMATVVNRGFGGENTWTRIVAPKMIEKSVSYVRIDSPWDLEPVIDEMRIQVARHNLKPWNVFVLAPKVKGGAQNPCVKLQKTLQHKSKSVFENRVSIFVSLQDDVSPHELDMRGKLCIMTYHQAKGRENDLVVVFGVDDSYFKYYNTTSPTTHLTEPLLVAMTRARKHLIIVEASDPVSFLDPTVMPRIVGTEKPRPKRESKAQEYVKRSVTQWTQHMAEHVALECFELLNVVHTTPPGKHLDLVDRIRVGRIRREPVSDINGIAMTMFIENTVQNRPEQNNPRLLIDRALQGWKEHNSYTHRNIQIPRDLRTWLDVDSLYAAARHVIPDLGPRVAFEYHVEKTATGNIDIVDESHRVLYEIKCVSHLKAQHFIQLAMYWWLSDKEDFVPRLVNVKTGQKSEIRCNFATAKRVYDRVISARVDRRHLDDEAFVERFNIW